MTDPVLSRRELLRDGSLLGGILGGGLWLATQLSFPQAARAAAASSEAAVLSPAEWRTLEAITSRIVPSDHEPGAREAQCVNFIDKALAHEEAAARPLYAAGLPGVEVAAQARHQLGFSELDAAQQDALLAAIQAGTAKGWPAAAGPSPVFFETLRVHTLIGFLADPKYGGNRDFAGWRVTRYPGPRHHHGGYTPEQVMGTAKVRTAWGSEQ